MHDLKQEICINDSHFVEKALFNEMIYSISQHGNNSTSETGLGGGGGRRL